MVETSRNRKSHGVIIICNNCGERTSATTNEVGYAKIRCRKCGVVTEWQEIGRRHVRLDIFAPHGQVLMGGDDD